MTEIHPLFPEISSNILLKKLTSANQKRPFCTIHFEQKNISICTLPVKDARMNIKKKYTSQLEHLLSFWSRLMKHKSNPDLMQYSTFFLVVNTNKVLEDSHRNWKQLFWSHKTKDHLVQKRGERISISSPTYTLLFSAKEPLNHQ